MYKTYNQNQVEPILKKLKRRRNAYTIAFAVFLVIGGFIGIVSWYASMACLILWGIAAGLAMYCINNIRYIASGGTKKGGGLWWALLFVFGMFIIPVITVQICAHVSPLSKLVLGVD